MKYTRDIRGVFTAYTYVSGMCRVCIGKASKDIGSGKGSRDTERGENISHEWHGLTQKREITISYALSARKNRSTKGR